MHNFCITPRQTRINKGMIWGSNPPLSVFGIPYNSPHNGRAFN